MKKWISIAVAVLVLFVAIGQMAQAADKDTYSKYGIRFRALYVKPTDSTDGILSTLNTKVSSDLVPEVDLEYFFTKNISAELVAAFTRHDIKLNGAYAGSTRLLPPTLTAKYHPLAGSTVSPYVGVGVNWTIPFDSHVNGVDDFSIDNSIGWALQVGTDVKIAPQLYLNFDYKYISIDTDATVAGTKCKLDVSPHLIGVGIGYRF